MPQWNVCRSICKSVMETFIIMMHVDRITWYKLYLKEIFKQVSPALLTTLVLLLGLVSDASHSKKG